MNLRLFAGVLVVTLLTGACAPVESLRRSDSNYNNTEDEARRYIEQMRDQPQPSATPRDTVRISNDQWVDRRPIQTVERRIPPALNCTIMFKPLVATGLLEFAQQVSQDCQIAVRVTPDAIVAVSGGNQGGNTAGGSASPTAGVPLPNLPALPALSFGGSQTSVQPLMSSGSVPGLLSDIDWRGPLAGLLDLVTARNGLSWRFNEPTRSISIFYLDTRTFRVDAIPVKTDIQSTIQSGMTTQAGDSGGGGAAGGSSGSSSGGGGVSGSSGSSQTTSMSMSSSLYADIETTIKSFLTPGAGRMAISESTGTVSVTDTPEVLDRIGALLASENATLTRQIILHTKILSVTLNDKNEAGVNWDLVYKSLSRGVNLTLRSPFQPATNAGTLGASVIGTGNFAGSSAVVSALSTLGNVRTITSPSVTTLNLRPAPVQIGRRIGYIASSQVSQTQGAGTIGGLTPGFVTVGFNMSMVPRLLEDDNEMVLQYAIEISSLNELRSVTAAGTTIEFPDIDTRLFNSQVRLRSGETLILHGFEQDETSGNRQGTFSPFAWMLGGGIKASHTRQAIVILITPQIIDSGFAKVDR